jgi:hypothetical protein
LSKSLEEITPAAHEAQRHETRLDELGSSVRALRDEVNLLQSQNEKKVIPVSVPRPSTVPAAPYAEIGARGDGGLSNRPNGNTFKFQGEGRHQAAKPALTDIGTIATDAEISRGAELFRQARYQEALDYFSKLETNHLDDARVWYFAALSHGFLTHEWTKGTVDLVEKGLERERAGTPGTARIDAAFSNLVSSTGKDWLATYRKRVNGQ